MQWPLQVRRLSEVDATAHYALRQGSLQGFRDPIESDVLREPGGGAGGLDERFARYGAHDTRVWGVFDQTTLAGVAAATLEPLLGDEGADLWSVFVTRRYRGTAVSRLLMDAMLECCEREWNVRVIRSTFANENTHALQFLSRFGFELLDRDEGGSAGSTRTMIRVCRD